VYKWVQHYNENPEQAFPGSGNLKPDDDAMRKAQRRIKELETEVDILKQAAVYFAKNSR
jgi:transposase